MKSVIAVAAALVALSSSHAFAECSLLDGAYVSESVLQGHRGDMIAFSQSYDGSSPNCTKEIKMTMTASVPSVETKTIVPDGKFRKTSLQSLAEAWTWEGTRLVRYDRENGKTVKGVEIFLEIENGRAILKYLAYVTANPNVFKLFAIAGPNAPM